MSFIKTNIDEKLTNQNATKCYDNKTQNNTYGRDNSDKNDIKQNLS